MCNDADVDINLDLVNRMIVNGFFDSHLLDQGSTVDEINSTLISVAFPLNINDWTILRNQIAYYFYKAEDTVRGDNIYKLSYPVNVEFPYGGHHLLLSEFQHDLNVVVSNLNDSDDKDVALAIFGTEVFGCRPEELSLIEVLSPNKFRIVGTSDIGQPCGDRTVICNYGVAGFSSKVLVNRIEMMKNIDISTVELKLRNLVTQIVSQLHHPLSLNAIRYQKGCDLIATGIDKKAVAYLMGHVASSDTAVYRAEHSNNQLTVIEAGISESDIARLIDL